MTKKYFNSIISALFTTSALLLNYVGIYKNGMKVIKSIFNTSHFVTAIVCVALFCFYNYNEKESKTNILQELVALFFSIVMVVGRSYEEINSWNMLFKNPLNMLVSLISLIGFYILFINIFKIINKLLVKINLDKVEFKNKNKFIKIFEDKPFIISLLTILMFWSIYLLAFYPGILTPDSSYQILQAFNVHTKYSDWIIQLDSNVHITNHHPVLYTFILGACVKLGKLIFNYNFGIFLCTVLQMLIFSSTLAYTIHYLKKIDIPSKMRLIILSIYCLVPMFAFYAVTNVKDTIYTAFIIIYIIQLYDYIKFYKKEKIPYKKLIYMLIIILLVSLFRNNGIYVIILSFVFAIFYTKINIKRMACVLICYFILYYSYTNVLLPYLKISDTSIRETLSVPFQQTARYVKYYSNELTQEEIEVIDKILGYETLAERYDPEIADPVKNEYNKYTTSEDLKSYFKVWFNGLLKHSDVYVQAFINNTYGYFYPSNEGWYIYYKERDTVNTKGNIDYHYNNLNILRKNLVYYGNGFRSIPVIGLISNIGFNTCILLIISVYFITDKKERKYLIMLLPHFVTLLVCLVSPVNNYFRYAMPYIFAMPITLTIFLKEITYKEGDVNGKE